MLNYTGNEHDHPAFLAFAAKLFIDFSFRDRILDRKFFAADLQIQKIKLSICVISLIN